MTNSRTVSTAGPLPQTTEANNSAPFCLIQGESSPPDGNQGKHLLLPHVGRTDVHFIVCFFIN
jgi:hypothetical protein